MEKAKKQTDSLEGRMEQNRSGLQCRVEIYRRSEELHKQSEARRSSALKQEVSLNPEAIEIGKASSTFWSTGERQKWNQAIERRQVQEELVLQPKVHAEKLERGRDQRLETTLGEFDLQYAKTNDLSREAYHQHNKHEYEQRVKKGELALTPTGSQTVSPRDIAMPVSQEQLHDPGFWPKYSPESCKAHAGRYQDLKDWISTGSDSIKLAQDPELQRAREFWLGGPPYELTRYRDTYVVDNGGRHRVVLSKIHGFDNLIGNYRVFEANPSKTG